MKPIIAISMGDFNGIGPEVILKALKQTNLEQSSPILIGHERIFEYYEKQLKTGFQIHVIDNIGDCISIDGKLNLLRSTFDHDFTPEPGKSTLFAGRAAMKAVEMGTSLCMDGYSDALVTGPISKESINKAGYHYPGHTEFLAEKSNSEDIQMILVYNSLRVALATIHIPVRDITRQLTSNLIQLHIQRLFQSLNKDFQIANPKIAVLGLNPHAGDGGVIGREEIDIIYPAIKQSQKSGIHVNGPFAADGFFGSRQWKNFDGILAMYHDQGLIPFKTIAFGKGVNFTAGLSFIRTSPDHGTGFDIAGRNSASETSFKAAYDLAVDLAINKFSNR
jgi:4-hydroxythreonine-4-phosphate dehydrogenase